MSVPELKLDDQRLMEQLCDFAAKHAQHGVYGLQLYSKTNSAPVLLVVAFGEQALALQAVIANAAERGDNWQPVTFPDEKGGRIIN